MQAKTRRDHHLVISVGQGKSPTPGEAFPPIQTTRNGGKRVGETLVNSLKFSNGLPSNPTYETRPRRKQDTLEHLLAFFNGPVSRITESFPPSLLFEFFEFMPMPCQGILVEIGSLVLDDVDGEFGRGRSVADDECFSLRVCI